MPPLTYIGNVGRKGAIFNQNAHIFNYSPKQATFLNLPEVCKDWILHFTSVIIGTYFDLHTVYTAHTQRFRDTRGTRSCLELTATNFRSISSFSLMHTC